MSSKNIINIAVGASSLKVVHCERRDTDVVIKNSVILDTSSNMFLNKETLNWNLIEDKLRIFFFENKIRGGKICFQLPDYMIETRLIHKTQILTKDYITGLIKTKQLHELIDDNIQDEENYIFDCQILSTNKYNSSDDSEGSTNIFVSFINKELVKGLVTMARHLKMTPSVLEPEVSGLLRFIDMFELKGNYFLVDIGEIYTKVYISFGSENIERYIMPAGMYNLDSLVAKFYKCSPNAASERRVMMGLNTNNRFIDDILGDVISDLFALPITEHLSTINTNYSGLHVVDKFLMVGGAWNTLGFKDNLEEKTLGLYEGDYVYEDFSQFTDKLIFDNEIVKYDIMENIGSYAHCLGLSLRGGM